MTIWNELAGLDFELTTVDAGGVPTRSLQAGSGDEAVIFLHGTSGHLEAFARNIAPHAESYRVHAIDMLGHGYTGKPDYPYEIPRYVEHLVNYLDAVGLDRVHLVGESLGGWVAAYLASEQPERVLSLQLLAAGGTVANPTVMERIKTSTAKAVQSDDIELTRARMQLLMHDPANATEELVQARHRIYHQPDFVANIHNLLSLQEMEVRQRNLLRPDRMALIKAPTLVVWGQENPFGDVPEAKKMAEDIPGAQLELYAECGHWPQHEQAAKYNPLSLEFLAKASASAKAAI
ncbi:alpha/beta hydrolase [Rhodococcus sp. ACPA4]|jgi:2-hydroxy-6-oxonona-2,4-dienedioate hydrolase|uniref:2-hydroxy-6-oxonona-2,4-dienedioate hydrolase n=3 Tax=Nocardiaceae TaxID=85025 RepID=A0A652YPK3_NOCGL|nr:MULTISPECIES: alpha/beta hydrolase [Rhodococcus]NMD62748.1 alpha/beta fold hydrolase [Nocardia globerula]MDV6267868.1 alpha/beta hydrolase [Rhodococcus globerulus]MDV8065848.1 alpha/beta hydrolase [Rhodococcus sp. IEGM 1366]PBC43972.1 alpha/beta hydrolase [Rhodococcus sp. ACPA4]PVX68202.1 2-hydroxy-6-oxonona-2,4-dienedioate hydrolase [Rhodococcus globerulus]